MSTIEAKYDEQITPLQSRFDELKRENNEIIADVPIEGKSVFVDQRHGDAFRENLEEMRELKEQIDMLHEAKGMNEELPGAKSFASLAQSADYLQRSGMLLPQGSDAKTIGQMFTLSTEFAELKESGSAEMRKPWTVNGIPDFAACVKWQDLGEVKDVYTSLPGGDIQHGFAPMQRDDIVIPAMRRARVRDLFQVQRTTAAVIEFFRLTGFIEANAASVVPERVGNEFGLKPHTELDFIGVQTQTVTLAHWEAAHRNVLDDVPGLQGIIDTELLYGLRLVEDAQILYGLPTGDPAGTGGIMGDTGLQTYARPGSNTTDTKADDVRRAATKAILSYYEPTGVVVHPSDWEDIELIKDDNGQYIVSVSVAEGGRQRLWRMPLVDTPAMNEGEFLLGAFGIGATLYDRQDANIRVSEHHQDFFLRNAIVILAEERLGLAVKRPESFVKGDFGA
jgi:HK97 family phage major capsid protein